MSGLIPPATLEHIRAASDIVEIIGGCFPLKRAGANFVALCPFHREKTPSFNVSPHRQIYHCFGCHKGGDVFRFVQDYENIGFLDAVRRLAERARIPLEFDNQPGQADARHIKDSLLQIHEQITQRWHNSLLNEAAGQSARDYLAKRGVSADAINLFRLGAAPDLWDDTVNWARSKDHDLALVEKAGLIIRRDGAEGFYDRFRGRLMFPICDEQGRVTGFSGRMLSGDEKTAKYVNSPETPIFTKSKICFGLDKSRRAILEAGFAVVCEGQLDLIACFTSGVQNIVAPQGTAFTDDHARILKRYTNEVVLCFDSDAAGQNATVRSLDSLLASGLAVRVAVVPAPHDPDSYIKEHGGAAFAELIDRAEGFFDFHLKRLCQLHDTRSDRGRLAVLHDMAQAVQKTGNVVLVDTYAQQTALRLAVSPDSVRKEFAKLAASRAPAPERTGELEAEPTAALPRPGPAEFWLLKLLLRHDELSGWLVTHLDPDWISHAPVRGAVTQILRAHTAETWHGVAGFLTECEDPALGELLTEVCTDERPIPDPARQVVDVIWRLRGQFLDRRLAELAQRASAPESPESERLDALRAQQQLREVKRQPPPPPPDLHVGDAA